MKKIIFLFLALLVCCMSDIYSQVTIGSLIEPEKGALLEVKNKAANADNATIDGTGGGIALPRVVLEDRETLQPFISITDPDWLSASATKIKERHAGLTVYNIKESPSTETNLNKIFRQGFYSWNGKQWKEAASGKEAFFNLPTFSLPLVLGANAPFDLYEEVYKKQFTLVSSRLYAREELDFVVTYYDDKILEISDLKADNLAGKMAYSVLAMPSNSLVPEILINVVLVVK
ncbi:MAG: hypothetical protein LBT25_01420 [Candidatus Symbiothrix sp.]|jgi:hypothetical protein|nr:hypothetical protein [Candidatus Symbiothrix sp.]